MHKNIRASLYWQVIPTARIRYGGADWEIGSKQEQLHKLSGCRSPITPDVPQGSAGLILFYGIRKITNLCLGIITSMVTTRRQDKFAAKHMPNIFLITGGMDGCFPGCNLRCTKGGWVTLASGEHKVRRSGWMAPNMKQPPVLVPIWACGVPEFIMEANWHCDNYGI